MKRPLPKELSNILNNLGPGWKLELIKYWSMGWHARLSVGNRQFDVVSERTYTSVYDPQLGQVVPPIELLEEISERQVADLLRNAVAGIAKYNRKIPNAANETGLDR